MDVWARIRLLVRNIAIVATLLVMATKASTPKITHQAMTSLGANDKATVPLELSDPSILRR